MTCGLRSVLAHHVELSLSVFGELRTPLSKEGMMLAGPTVRWAFERDAGARHIEGLTIVRG